MNFDSAKEKLSEAFTAAQNLQIQPTKPNVDCLSTILDNLSTVFEFLEQLKQEKADRATIEEKKEE